MVLAFEYGFGLIYFGHILRTLNGMVWDFEWYWSPTIALNLQFGFWIFLLLIDFFCFGVFYLFDCSVSDFGIFDSSFLLHACFDFY